MVEEPLRHGVTKNKKKKIKIKQEKLFRKNQNIKGAY